MMHASKRIPIHMIMRRLIGCAPAWLLRLLPVRFARLCVVSCPTTTASSAQPVRQLLVDVSVIHQSDARTGIQRVVRSLLLQLFNEQPIGFQVCPIFATQQDGYRYANPCFLDASAPTNIDTCKPVRVQHGDLFLGLDLAAHLLPRHHAQVLGWKRLGVKVHIVVYDLLPLQYPQWFNPKTNRNFKRWIKWVAVYADRIVCISDTVKADVTVWLDVVFGLTGGTLPVQTIMLGADINASAPTQGITPNAEILLARMQNTRSVLMVATVEPRKSHAQLLAAFDLLWRTTNKAVPLCIFVGRPGWKTEEIQAKIRNHPLFGDALFWLENVSDELLVRLYIATDCVVIASQAEGFGLPIVEAVRYGKPVLIRDIPVFRELSLPNISYFSDDSPSSLSSAIEQLLEQSANQIPLAVNTGFHSWQATGKQLFRALGIDLRNSEPKKTNTMKDPLQS